MKTVKFVEQLNSAPCSRRCFAVIIRGHIWLIFHGKHIPNLHDCQSIGLQDYEHGHQLFAKWSQCAYPLYFIFFIHEFIHSFHFNHYPILVLRKIVYLAHYRLVEAKWGTHHELLH